MFVGSSPITFTSPSSKAHQKSGSFPPPALPGLNGRMTLSDSRHGRRLEATLRPLPSPVTGLPRLLEPPFRRAVPTTPADRAGARVDCFLLTRPSPNGRRVGIRIVTFEACSGFTHVTARRVAQPLTRPLSRGSNPCSCPHELLVSYRINRQLSGWNLPPLVIRAFGAHCQKQTFSGTLSEIEHILRTWGQSLASGGKGRGRNDPPMWAQRCDRCLVLLEECRQIVSE